MSVDQRPPPADQQPADVLSAYIERMGRQRRRYAIVLAVIAVAALVLTEVVLRTGESAHARLHQAASAAPAPTSTTASDTQTLAWRSADATAAGNPVYQGTVVTYSAHTVTGRNYASGAAMWTYTRTDVTICTVFQENGTTIAVYDLDGNCDEASAFVTGTGARSWYRTLDSNGNAIDGRPVYAASQSTILMIEPNFVWAIEPSGGLDRWIFLQPSGCTTTSAVLGGSGVLIGQHCADGYHLVLRDPELGDDDSGKTQPTKWRLNTTDMIPASADDLVSAIDPQTAMLVQYRASDGHVLGSHALTPTPNLKVRLSVANQTGSELITAGDTSYWVDAVSGKQLWSAQLAGPPSLAGPNPLAIDSTGIVELDPRTGAPSASYLIPAPAPGSSVFQVGSGFVVAGSSTTVYR